MTLQRVCAAMGSRFLPAWEEETALLQRFAERYPEAYTSVRPSDSWSWTSLSLLPCRSGEAFAAHCAGGGKCNEV
jgi:hypothetical protein